MFRRALRLVPAVLAVIVLFVLPAAAFNMLFMRSISEPILL